MQSYEHKVMRHRRILRTEHGDLAISARGLGFSRHGDQLDIMF
jgi:hypothetical protein